MDPKSNGQSTATPVGGLLATGLGYGLRPEGTHSAGIANSSSTTATSTSAATSPIGVHGSAVSLGRSGERADGVSVYLKRAATLILAAVVGPKVFGEGALTWEQRAAANCARRQQLALQAAKDSSPPPYSLDDPYPASPTVSKPTATQTTQTVRGGNPSMGNSNVTAAPALTPAEMEALWRQQRESMIRLSSRPVRSQPGEESNHGNVLSPMRPQSTIVMTSTGQNKEVDSKELNSPSQLRSLVSFCRKRPLRMAQQAMSPSGDISVGIQAVSALSDSARSSHSTEIITTNRIRAKTSDDLELAVSPSPIEALAAMVACTRISDSSNGLLHTDANIRTSLSGEHIVCAQPSPLRVNVSDNQEEVPVLEISGRGSGVGMQLQRPIASKASPTTRLNRHHMTSNGSSLMAATSPTTLALENMSPIEAVLSGPSNSIPRVPRKSNPMSTSGPGPNTQRKTSDSVNSSNTTRKLSLTATFANKNFASSMEVVPSSMQALTSLSGSNVYATSSMKSPINRARRGRSLSRHIGQSLPIAGNSGGGRIKSALSLNPIQSTKPRVSRLSSEVLRLV